MRLVTVGSRASTTLPARLVRSSKEIPPTLTSCFSIIPGSETQYDSDNKIKRSILSLGALFMRHSSSPRSQQSGENLWCIRPRTRMRQSQEDDQPSILALSPKREIGVILRIRHTRELDFSKSRSPALYEESLRWTLNKTSRELPHSVRGIVLLPKLDMLELQRNV